MTSSIYTRTGDEGGTRLGNGAGSRKDSLRIEAIGAVDELNAQVGMVAAHPDAATEAALLEQLQNTLFEVGAELAAPGKPRIAREDVGALEKAIDRIDGELPPLTHFILPGGTLAGAQCHLARTVCRRAERALFRLAEAEAVNSETLKYVNRLSDLLFVLARQIIRQGGGKEVLWKTS
jgi:cob(I)alamin adenosyltransferase